MLRHQKDAHGKPVWVAAATGLPTKIHQQRLRRRFRKAEQALGMRLLFGGGHKNGGGKLWTTIQKLRECGFVDDMGAVAATAEKHVKGFRLEIDELYARQGALGHAWNARMERLEARVKAISEVCGFE